MIIDQQFAALVFAIAVFEWLRYPVAGDGLQLGAWTRRDWLFAYAFGVALRTRGWQ